MRFPPAIIQLRRAQLILVLAVLVPTILLTAIGIVLLFFGEARSALAGVLVLTLCTTGITGYVLGSIFVGKGASLARVQNDFLSSVSHELRTPITSIRLLLESLADGRLEPGERTRVMQLLGQEAQRLESLAGRLIELSRMETGAHIFEQRPIDARELLEEAVAAFDAATLSEPTPIGLEVEPGLSFVGDRPALVRALVNLLTNAWKYTERDKQIALSARTVGRWIELTVRDNGIGLERGEHRTIFEQFERGQAATARGTPGSGLGLAFVRAIVRGHGGRVDVKSRPGQGSEFTLRLPRRARARTAAPRSATAAATLEAVP
ncbi:MAG: two-component sensor histidine kinase [Kofleriaceae bacterium]|nr:two-component sensor histidine kinase [Kofleriaceae bacterium]MBP6838006.1 two-component sensor histidine kinase [Kofleriaceae bacterium]MBP9205422.1 two-component sensor histidine kinase [Kofleriaceae bacterium]